MKSTALLFVAAALALVIITAKHHDRFCLWPSMYTDHSVAGSPRRGGRGDVVRELAEACSSEGMRLGIYLSPWDRHEPTYGDSPCYNEYFRKWSVIPDRTRNLDSIAAHVQRDPVDLAFVQGDLTGEDLGSRARIRNARSLLWYPAETDVSIRPGWFYHAAGDSAVKSPGKLVDIYYNSVTVRLAGTAFFFLTCLRTGGGASMRRMPAA